MKREDKKSQAKKKWKIKETQLLFFYITTEIFLYGFEYFNLHYITKWLFEAMFVNFLSWANLW